MTLIDDYVRLFLKQSRDFTVTHDFQDFVPVALLYRAFSRWLNANNGKRLSIFEFGRACSQIGLSCGHMKFSRPQVSSICGVRGADAIVDPYVTEKRSEYAHKLVANTREG